MEKQKVKIMARRSKEEIERDEKMREQVKTELVNLVHSNWDSMKEATGGTINIMMKIDKEDNNCEIIYGFQRTHTGKHSFKLDDGQKDLGLNPSEGS